MTVERADSAQPRPSARETATVAAVRRALLDTSAFSNPISVEYVRAVGRTRQTELEVALRLERVSETLYVLHTNLSEWDFVGQGFGEPTPNEWASWIYVAVMEAVDASAGLPAPKPGEAVVRVSLDD